MNGSNGSSGSNGTARFAKLYHRAVYLNCLEDYSEMERKVTSLLDELEKVLDEEEAILDAQVEREKETGRCTTCGRPLLECWCF